MTERIFPTPPPRPDTPVAPEPEAISPEVRAEVMAAFWKLMGELPKEPPK